MIGKTVEYLFTEQEKLLNYPMMVMLTINYTFHMNYMIHIRTNMEFLKRGT